MSNNKAVKREVTRKCVGCGEIKPKADMMRVVKSSEGVISLDATLKANGRGAYICKSADCIKKAIDRKGLARSFKCELSDGVRDSLLEEFDKLGIR